MRGGVFLLKGLFLQSSENDFPINLFQVQLPLPFLFCLHFFCVLDLVDALLRDHLRLGVHEERLFLVVELFENTATPD